MRMDDTSQCVKVAVNVRPLITPELLVGCTDCITVTPGEPQVQLGSHAFTFDYVFGSIGSPSHKIFDVCVAPLVEALFSGYNATVLAYGQTGSGKTYTMGTNYTGEHHIDGIIPKVMEMIFQKVETSSNDTEFLIRVSFIEIFKEEVFDLLDSSAINSSKAEGNSVVKPVAPPKNPIQIRETVSGGITLSGIIEPEVQSKEEMAGFLARGALARATGSTNMNSQSSRSHAIFTISVQQKRTATSVDSGGSDNDASESILGAKLHLVDLAGSERAKRTGADGLRLKEGIHINRGLLALGNVISALGDEKKRKEGAHVPYRDSKLTRLLQDSLGGNSKTVMIACVSPADTNAEETLNTLKYANRARNIQNKPIINRDPVAAQMQRMRSQLEQLQTELLFYRGEGTSFDEFQILKHKISVLEASNAELRRELLESKNSSEHFAQSAIDSQVEKDRLLLKIELARAGKPWEEIDNGDDDQDTCLVTNYVKKIQELEAQLHQLRNINDSCASSGPMGRDLENDGIQGHHIVSGNLNDDFDDEEKEREHSSLQNELGRELQELDKQLEQKEEEIKRVATVDTSILKQHYEKKLLELEHEKKSLQKEIENLRSNLASISSSDDNAQKLKESYLQKLNILEAQVAELKRKQEAQSQLLKQKQKSDDAGKRLQDEIQRIKAQKVQLQHKIKQESEQFRSWKVSREKEVLQLRKEGRRNEFEMHKLLALNQRQKMFLQRKTEEASMAAKRLKELLEAKKASFRDIGAGNGNAFTVQGAIQSIEHELEVIVRVHEVRRKYDRSMEERAAWAKELAQLKEEAEVFKQKHIGLAHTQTLSPGARSSRIFALENMLKTSSKTLVDMASQLSAAAESEGNFNGKGRWNGVRSLPDAKSLLNFLFELVSSSRCQLRDMELAIDEKDSTIKELKEKVVELSSIFRKSVANTCDTHAKSIMLLEGPRIRSKKKLGDQMVPTDVVTFSDMDITDSDQSKTTDTEWEQSESEWELSGYNYSNHPLGRKRARKYEAHSKVMGSLPEEKNERSLKPEVCCSCSKNSLCKRKCECVNAGGLCGLSCGCLTGKCTNREAGNAKDDSQVGTERDNALVSLGTRLLESALGDKLIDSVEGDAHTRKPLADIGNSVNVGHKQQKQRKKWGKKSVVQLIPTAPLPATSENNGSEARDWANETVSTDSIALKLPRAMTPMNTSNILRERNSNSTGTQNTKSMDPANDTDTRSPLKQMRVKREKENKGA